MFIKLISIHYGWKQHRKYMCRCWLGDEVYFSALILSSPILMRTFGVFTQGPLQGSDWELQQAKDT